MYDGGKIITGLIIGIGLLLLPFWPIGNKWASKPPKPELTPKAKEAGKCVEPKDFIRQKHMELLDKWRDTAIREGNRLYRSTEGVTYNISLQNTCLDCHSNKAKFCDQCHNYTGVKPFCWECHFESKEKR